MGSSGFEHIALAETRATKAASVAKSKAKLKVGATSTHFSEPSPPASGGGSVTLFGDGPMSRAGCHFAAAIGLRSMLEDFAPTLPDWANDQHTLAGRKLGRGLDHFRKDGAKLIPPPTDDDPYEDEAYRLWQIKQGKR
jgi:hypothetical protein